MVRRATAREKFGREDKSAQMYTALGWRVVLLARMSCARVCPFKTRRSLRTIRNSRLRTRRCDCSFVVTYPVQTSVEKLQTVVVVVWESGSAQRFQAEGAFSTPLGCDGSVLVAAGQHSPGDAGQLVGHGDYDDVFVRSGGCDKGCKECGNRADAERPSRAEMIRNPTDDRSPIDVPPSATPTRIAIPRPRMVGLVESCIILFVAFVKVRAATPITPRAAANHQYPGEKAASAQPIPKTPVPRSNDPKFGLSPRAARSAPLIVPIAMIDDSKPNPRASAWKTFTAMVEMKIGKLKPNVPIRKSMTTIDRRSGLAHT
jgi:hypothetical protein